MLEREPDGAGWRVTFRARGLVRYLPAAFLAFWLCGWIVGEYFALGLLAGALRHWFGASIPLGWLPEMHGTPPSGGAQLFFGGFLAVWLTAWTFGGLAALAQLLQLLFGHEVVRVDGDTLVVERRAPFPLSVSRVNASDIRGFRMRARTVHADTRRRAVAVTQFTTPDEGAELMALLEAWHRSYHPAAEGLTEGEPAINGWTVVTDESGALAVDARIVIQSAPAYGQHGQNYGHLPILPYPSHFQQEWPLRGGGVYTVRPVRPDDASMLQGLVKGLSTESRYFRFVSSMPELPARMLARFTLIDYDREMALVAVHRERKTGPDGAFIDTERVIGVSRYVTNPDTKSCEFSLLVADDFAGQGLGSRLMLSIIEFARNKGLAQIEGLILANNGNMLKLMRNLGFQIKHFAEDPDFRLAVKLL